MEIFDSNEAANEWMDREAAKNMEENTKRLVHQLRKKADYYDHEKAKAFEKKDRELLEEMHQAAEHLLAEWPLIYYDVINCGHLKGAVDTTFAVMDRIKAHRENGERG